MTVLIGPPAEDIERIVRAALSEDLGGGDITADLIPASTRLLATVVCREEAVLCGRPWFDKTFEILDPETLIEWSVADGGRLRAGQTVCEVSGRARALVSGERTALNFLQSLSGTATATRRYAEAIDGYPTRLLDTRKTLPGLRLAQKYAVRCGGGHNHRLGLYDGVLIKENHIGACGSITAAVERMRSSAPGVVIEVEVESLAEVGEAIEAGADRLLLDNFSLADMRDAVILVDGAVQLEASGGFEFDALREVAATGVDFISVGALTKHVRAIDFSMRFIAGVPE